jgi:hypothetical protein
MAEATDLSTQFGAMNGQIQEIEADQVEDEELNEYDVERGPADVKWGNLARAGFKKLAGATRDAADGRDDKAASRTWQRTPGTNPTAKVGRGEELTYMQGGKKVTAKVVRVEPGNGDVKYTLSNGDALYQSGLKESVADLNPLQESEMEDPRRTGKPVEYRGWVIGFDPDAAQWTGEGYYFHKDGWEPGDPDGETGRPDTRGYWSARDLEFAMSEIDSEIEEEGLAEDDDWYSQDDLQDYNDNEADDYRNEGDDEDDPQAMDPSSAVFLAADQLGISLQGNVVNDVDLSQAQDLIRELTTYGHQYRVVPQDNGAHIEFHCADPGSVNLNYNPIATAWVDENGNFYYEA